MCQMLFACRVAGLFSYAVFFIFPHSTPCVRFSPHTAFHRRILADLRPSLRYSLQVPSSLRPLLFSTGSAAYCSSSAYILLWMPNTFPRSDNPIRYHTPLGACYGTDDFFDSLSHASPYLAVSSTCITAWTVSLYFAGSSGSFRAMLTVGVLWTTGISVGCLSQPSADFTELRTVKLSLSTARRSLWWMFPSIGLSVLLQFITAVRNLLRYERVAPCVQSVPEPTLQLPRTGSKPLSPPELPPLG